MLSNISLFPTITDELLAKVRFQKSEYSFFYIRDDEKYELLAEEIDNSTIFLKITDPEGIWNPDDYNLGISRKYSLRTYQSLFGKDGIACSNAKLGLAIVWTSSDSKQRGVIHVGEIQNSNSDIELNVEYEFPVAQLRGDIEFTTVVYIKESGTPKNDEEHLANSYGYLLGELDKVVIRLDGNGSVFPMYEVTDPGQPLWYLKCDWEDPTYEQFADCVSVNINTAHKNYKFLDKTKRTFDEELLKDIMASALTIVIMKLKDQNTYWDQTINNSNLAPGSVSEAVYYYISTLEWDVSSPELISLTIRKFLDQRM